MKIALIPFKWGEFRRKVLGGWNKRRHDQFLKVKSERQRSIGILQKRYGYSEEQATSEFDKHYSKAWLG